jgi:succinoglycan biosynthesis protein ExoA
MTTLISAIVPCLNEEAYIGECLASIGRFELPAGCALEILVLDGGSTDGTRSRVEEAAAGDPRIRLIDNPGRIQSTAMNTGLAAARGEWIMRLDVHAVYPAGYLRVCLETAQRTGADNVGGLLTTLPGGPAYPAQLVQALTTHRFGVGDSGFRTGAREGPVDTVPFGFFPRELFERIGLFDERLVRAQDYEFNRRIAAAGGTVWCRPDLVVTYYNQPTLRAFLRKQFRLEAPYNAYMWYLAPYAFAPRHAVTAAFTAGLAGGALLGPLTPWIGLPWLGVLALYTGLALYSAAGQARRYRRPRHLAALPASFFLYHLVHGLGVWSGLIRLLLKQAPVQKKAEPWPGAGRRRAWPRP